MFWLSHSLIDGQRSGNEQQTVLFTSHVDAFGTKIKVTELRGYDLATRKEDEPSSVPVTS